MKKLCILLFGTLLMITSCAPTIKDDEIVQKKDETANQKTSIVPSYRYSKEDYKVVLPYRPSKTRGLINQLDNRVDIDEMEEGLRRHSKEVFDPNKYFVEEGQYLTEDIVSEWIKRKLTENQLEDEKEDSEEEISDADLQTGLNPAIEDSKDTDDKKAQEKAQRNNPKYLSHILEKNFIVKKEDNTVELAGVSLGLAIKSVYHFQVDGLNYDEEISEKEMLKQGKEMAQTVLERARKINGLEKVPIMIALYREESRNSLVPGNFVAKTTVSKGDMFIDDWDTIKEDYILFPSDEANEKYYDDAQLIDTFGQKVLEYFPNYVGVIGEGFYIDERLEKLTIEIPIEFYGKGEVIGFTQYAYGLVKEMFKDYYDLEIRVVSNNQLESIITRNAGEDNPTVHMLH